MNVLMMVADAYAEASLLVPVALLMLLMGAGVLAWPLLAAGDARTDVKRRLKVQSETPIGKPQPASERNNASIVHQKAVKKARDFYMRSDPENVARLRMRLIQAGYAHPNSVGNFFLIRLVMLAVFACGAFLVFRWSGSESSALKAWTFIAASGGIGYFLPGFVLSYQISQRAREYRNGFPDFMDLMIVCSDAGLSMEAGIERVSKELASSYPALSHHLQLVSHELRAGRSLDDALKSLSDRLNLEEVRSFATLLQQSKELGTSLSGALRVFSDDMRHKRMSAAEEKAHALPAKMSVPVTVCILPVVLMIAIIPVIVKLTLLD